MLIPTSAPWQQRREGGDQQQPTDHPESGGAERVQKRGRWAAATTVRRVFEPDAGRACQGARAVLADQLELISEFMAKMTDFLREQAVRVRELPPR